MSSSDGVAGEAAKMQIAPPASTESFEVYKKKQAVAPPTSASGVQVVVDSMLAPGQKRKTPEEEELAKKRAKAGEKGEDGPSGGIKEATAAGASVVPMAMAVAVGDRVGGKVLPKEPSVLNPMVESAMSKHGAATTVRQIREHLISMGYSRDSVVEAKDLLKEIGNSIYPDANKGEGIRDGDKDGDKTGGKDKIGNVGMAQGNLMEGNKKERTGRFTKEEDELLLNAINAAIGKLQGDVDIEAFKAALCGPKARGEARKKTVSEVWDEAFQALPMRSRTSCYDRGRRLLQDTRRGNWSDDELAQIKDLVEKSGNNINWQQIGAELSRPASACKDIYRHRIQEKSTIVPEGDVVPGGEGGDQKECTGSGRWSEVESKALVAYVKGKLAEGISDRSISWIEASKHIKTRNADQCRLHWRSVATGRGYSGKEGGDAAGGGVGGSGKVDWVWKRDRWTPEEDAELGRKVREQVEARGITMPSEIAWADIAVKNRLPHMSKERFRRRGEGLREASLIDRCVALLSPPAKGKGKTTKKLKGKSGEDEDEEGGMGGGITGVVPEAAVVNVNVPSLSTGVKPASVVVDTRPI